MGQPESSRDYDVDVVVISDLRLPGGTTSSIAEEVRAQSEAGVSTALIHAQSDVTTYPAAWSAHIQSILGLPGVHVASPRQPLRAKTIILRHPTVAETTPETFPHLSADHLVVVVNHAAIDAGGVQHYSVEAADARLRGLFGLDPVWAPIGPVVRGTVLQQTRRVPLRDEDWVNVFRVPGGAPERTGFLGEKPIIGRHSRPQAGKWPATKGAILAAYPESEKYQVEILGGAQIAEKLVGRVPTGWNVIPFGGEDPHHFLQRIDFWVYMHHPDLKEAFGRAAMEALAAGCVAVMPPYMEELFGDAAVYARPKEVQGIINSYWADPEKFLAQSRRAQEFAASFSPEMHLRRLEEFGVYAPPKGRLPQADSKAPQIYEAMPQTHRADGPASSTTPAPVAQQILHQPAEGSQGEHQSLEQWAASYYQDLRLRPRRTDDFAPHTVTRKPSLFYDLPVVLVVMTHASEDHHAAVYEAIQRLYEATYAFRPVALTDGSAKDTLAISDWRVEDCSGSTATLNTVEELTWAQLQLGASEVVAAWDDASLQQAVHRIADFAQAHPAVTAAALACQQPLMEPAQ